MKKKNHNHTKTYFYRLIRIHATFNKLQIQFTYTKECEGKTLSRIKEITSSFIWFLHHIICQMSPTETVFLVFFGIFYH